MWIYSYIYTTMWYFHCLLYCFLFSSLLYSSFLRPTLFSFFRSFFTIIISLFTQSVPSSSSYHHHPSIHSFIHHHAIFTSSSSSSFTIFNRFLSFLLPPPVLFHAPASTNLRRESVEARQRGTVKYRSKQEQSQSTRAGTTTKVHENFKFFAMVSQWLS